MHKYYSSLILSLLIIKPLLSASGVANPAIGLAVSNGKFQIDGFQATTNGTIVNGTTVENQKSPSHVSLNTGTHLDLAAETQGQVFSDHLVLSFGSVQTQSHAHYKILANGLQVEAAAPDSVFRVKRPNEKDIRVECVSGDATVQSVGGVLVARVLPGEAMDLGRVSDATSTAAKVSGCLQQAGTHFVLRDQTTHVVVEIKGADVASHLGTSVSILGFGEGSTTTGISQLISASAWQPLGIAGCPRQIAHPADAQQLLKAQSATVQSTTGGSVGGAGVGIGVVGPVVAVVAGVSAESMFIGLATSGAFNGSVPPSGLSTGR